MTLSVFNSVKQPEILNKVSVNSVTSHDSHAAYFCLLYTSDAADDLL